MWRARSSAKTAGPPAVPPHRRQMQSAAGIVSIGPPRSRPARPSSIGRFGLADENLIQRIAARPLAPPPPSEPAPAPAETRRAIGGAPEDQRRFYRTSDTRRGSRVTGDGPGTVQREIGSTIPRVVTSASRFRRRSGLGHAAFRTRRPGAEQACSRGSMIKCCRDSRALERLRCGPCGTPWPVPCPSASVRAR